MSPGSQTIQHEGVFVAPRSDVMKAMAIARIDDAIAKASKNLLRKCLKSFALVEIAKLSKKFPGKEVCFTFVGVTGTLTIDSVVTPKEELCKRFDVASKQLGSGVCPQGLFLGVDGHVCFTPLIAR